MEKQEQTLEPEKSLEIIQRMIRASQQQFADNGSYMILWAIVLILASLVNYALLYTNLDKEILSQWIGINWIFFPIVGGILSFIVGNRQSHEQQVKTHVGQVLKFMWIGYGITLFFIIFFPLQKGISPIPFILLLTGFATFIFGLGVKYTPFIIGSVCFLLLAIAAFLASYENEILIFALAIALGYLVPGLMLYRKVKHQNFSENV